MPIDSFRVRAKRGEMMKVGDRFIHHGCSWKCISVKKDSNKLFKWLVVIAKWTGEEPRPICYSATEEVLFLMERKKKRVRKVKHEL